MTEASTSDQTTETKRDRVRRLLIQPLADIGFRHRRGVSDADGRAFLDQLADDLAYLTDLNLQRLEEAMRSKGEGSARSFWPPRAAFLALAQVAQPRPLVEMPALASWFASEAGRRALEHGRLVAELRFWRRKHRPPLNDVERRRIAEDARDGQARVDRIRERLARGVLVDQPERAYLDAYDADEHRALELVRCHREDAA